MLYVLDTSALIDAWTKWYSPDILLSFWENIERLSESGDLTIPDAVLLELKPQDDDLYRWVHSRKEYICTQFTEDIQRLVQKIANRYPNLRHAGTPSKNLADPVVIAVAEHFNCAVVTHEKATGNLNGPKIPDVCRDMDIRVMQFHHLVREQNWQFL